MTEQRDEPGGRPVWWDEVCAKELANYEQTREGIHAANRDILRGKISAAERNPSFELGERKAYLKSIAKAVETKRDTELAAAKLEYEDRIAFQAQYPYPRRDQDRER